MSLKCIWNINIDGTFYKFDLTSISAFIFWWSTNLWTACMTFVLCTIVGMVVGPTSIAPARMRRRCQIAPMGVTGSGLDMNENRMRVSNHIIGWKLHLHFLPRAFFYREKNRLSQNTAGTKEIQCFDKTNESQCRKWGQKLKKEMWL